MLEATMTGKTDWERDADARLRDYEVQDQKDAQMREQMKKSPFSRHGFTQFSDKQMEHLRKMSLENPVAMAIFWFLTEHMSTANAVMCPYGLLEKITGKSKSTVIRAVGYLKDARFLGTKKVGGATLFHMNAAVVWHSHGDKIHYAELRAPILLDPEENPNLKVKEGRVNVIEQMELGI